MSGLSMFGAPSIAVAIVSIVLGILIIRFPQIIAYIIGIGLIIIGIMFFVSC